MPTMPDANLKWPRPGPVFGNAAKAEAIARQAEPHTADMPVERAGLQLLLGKADDAIRTLEQAVQNGYRN